MCLLVLVVFAFLGGVVIEELILLRILSKVLRKNDAIGDSVQL